MALGLARPLGAAGDATEAGAAAATRPAVPSDMVGDDALSEAGSDFVVDDEESDDDEQPQPPEFDSDEEEPPDEREERAARRALNRAAAEDASEDEGLGRRARIV